MSVITLFSGNFCNEEDVLREVQKKTGFRRIGEEEILKQASVLSGMPEKKIYSAFSSKPSVFNRFTHEKERAVAHLRMALAEFLAEDRLLISGFCTHLIPKSVTHVLRVCLIADVKYRVSEAQASGKFNEKEAMNLIRRYDEDCAYWLKMLWEKEENWDPVQWERKDPWTSSLYDIMIPADKTSPAEAASLIAENASAPVLKMLPSSRKAVENFHLAACVEAVLTREGHDVGVTAKDGVIILTINKHVLMLSRLEEDLKAIAEKVEGVKSVETVVGKNFHRADIYRKVDFEIPSKVLLVDDEREFVQTLSERLMMRDMGSAVAYDGQSALDIVRDDDPEVMILDLKMPGIDGIEVLRRVKETRPDIEIIILTGHGSEADRKVCMELGAFAYLQKPVDIDVLSENLKAANEKIQKKKAGK
ncbi:MAG: response regulator [Desulfococcaceae bacterium]